MAKTKREDFGVKVNDEIVIKGTISFSQLAELIDGEALAEENRRRQSKGMIMADGPFRSVTIENPEVVKGAGTPLAKYYEQDVYTSKKGIPTIKFESKSKFPPTYGHMIDDNNVAPIADPKRNPETGQIVYIHLKAYTVKGYSNIGSSFNTIVFEKGPIKFFGGNTSAIEGFGKAYGVNVVDEETIEMPTETPETTPTNTTNFGMNAAEAQAQAGANPGFGGQTNPFGENTANTPFNGSNPFDK